nr:MAG TPA: hypothetical protein [Caudoviricetes sp.]
MKGIDVSTLQGVIDWQTAGESIDFAMIKATQGRGEGAATRLLPKFTDSKFKRNIQNCGCPRGVYHYFTARDKSTAKAEADYFCAIVEPYRKNITLWAALDVESFYLSGLGRTELTAVVRTALDHIKACGFKPMLYTNPNFLKFRFESGAFDDTDIWLAHWRVKTPYSVPRMKIWQYGTAAVPGISGKVDADIGYFDENPTRVWKVGDAYTLSAGDTYTTGQAVPKAYWGKTYTVWQVKPGAVLLKEIVSWVEV